MVAHKPLISIIVVNYNAGNLLKRCLDGVKAQTFHDFELVLVDNGSTDGSVEALGDLPDFVHLIEADENLGFAKANNLGAEQSTGTWIATLNPDAVPHPDWLSQFVRALVKHRGVALFGSTLFTLDKTEIMDGLGDCYFAGGLAWRAGHGQYRPETLKDREVFGPCAAAAFYRRDLFEDLGGFEEDFFCYMEDVDLAFRFRRIGQRCIQLANSCVDHAGSAIAGRHSGFARYHGMRNLIWTWWRNMPLRLMPLAFPFHLLVIFGLLGKWVLSAAQGSSNRDSLRGAWHGLLGIPKQLGKRRSSLGQCDEEERAHEQIANALCWSPLTPLSRDIHVIRPWQQKKKS